LSNAKGLAETIDTFAVLRQGGVDVELSLAGEANSREAKRLIAQAVADSAGRVEHLGPVYDRDKSRFFANIDAFVFPTHSESWGLVVGEAMAAGVPVIAFKRGCMATVVGTEAGLLVDPQAAFVEQAVTQINRWINNEDEYRAASRAAVEQATRLHQEGKRTLAEFAEHMFSAPGTRRGLWQAT
jgi:glycosyltransferase involved in cell wall biosynthesis